MASLGKKVGYLRGLLEGMNLDANDLNGKFFLGLVDVVSELSDQVEEMDDVLDELNDYVESIDDDLSELEGACDDEDDDDEDDEDFGFLHSMDDDFDDDDFESEDQLHLLGGDDSDKHFSGDNLRLLDEQEEEALAGGVCPDCGGMSFMSGDAEEDALYVCPHCAKKVHLLPLTEDNTPIARPAEDE